MIVSEAAALSLRCCGPMPCGKQNPKYPPERTCVGSKCMGWVQIDKIREVNEEPKGYCGLAE